MKFGRGVNSGDVDTHVYFEDSTTYFGHLAKDAFLAIWPKIIGVWYSTYARLYIHP